MARTGIHSSSAIEPPSCLVLFERYVVDMHNTNATREEEEDALKRNPGIAAFMKNVSECLMPRITVDKT